MIRRHEEEGAVAVVVGVSLIALMLAASIVVDIGLARVDRRMGQTAADLAAAAAITGYDPSQAGVRIASCEEAVTYAEVNLEVELTPLAGESCAVAFNSVCDPATVNVARYEAGPYLVEITAPVPDPDPANPYNLMQGFAQAPDVDGTPCERIGVRVVLQRDTVLGGLASIFDITTNPSAVARRFQEGEEFIFASLIVLDRVGCSSLRSSGGPSAIEVTSYTDPVTGEVFPGFITVDSVPTSCGANNRVFDVDSGHISATGDIFSAGMVGTETCTIANNYFDDCPPALDPSPIEGNPVTRLPIDERYNCLDPYPVGPEPYLPASTSINPPTFRQPLNGVCGDSDPTTAGAPPYLKLLYDYVQPKNAAQFAAAGFDIYGDDGAEPCNDAVLAATTAQTRWFVDCADLVIRNGSTFAIPNAELVVTRGGIDVNGGGILQVNASRAEDATLYMQTGDLTVQGTIELHRTFTYLNTTSSRFNKTGGGNLYAEAPDATTTACDTSGLWPTASCFEDLAFWQNGVGTGPSDEFGLGGNGGIEVIGTVFAPNALVNVGGSGSTDLAEAQFFAWSFWYHGGGTLQLIPNPDKATRTPIFGTGLIR